MIPGIVDLDIYRGDSWSQTFVLKKGNEPIDLSTATVQAMATGRTGTSIGSDVNLTVYISTEETGMLTISGDDALTVGDWSYDVQVTDAGGEVTTWIRGNLKVIPDVTQ